MNTYAINVRLIGNLIAFNESNVVFSLKKSMFLVFIRIILISVAVLKYKVYLAEETVVTLYLVRVNE